jgi:hypothetical protein
MLALRAANAGNESRLELRALATDFPGALRELDGMATEEITRRLAACERAAAGDEGEPWIAWVARYHELVRELLAARQKDAQALGRRRGEHVNAAVLARLAEELSVTPEELRAVLFPPRARRR